MIHESYFHTDDEYYFMIHSELLSSRPTLLFIHGLGDAHMHYRAYLDSDLINHYNLLIPDLLGHGKSSAAQDYSFQHQVKGIEQHIDYLQKTLEIKLSDFILIAHSMGGIHATLLCESNLQKSIKAFINVEGSITQFGSFIAEDMVKTLKKESFMQWYDHFKQKKIYETLALEYVSIRPYYAGLECCHPDAFLKNALQMYEMSKALAGKYTNMIGKKYAKLMIPKIYCYGDSLCKETLAFLNEYDLASRHFPAKNHFLLSECLDEFIVFIHHYVKSL